jgi:hypothetical protein
MTDPAPGAAPEPAAETWTYGGIRAGKDGKRRHAWLDPGGKELLFASAGRITRVIGGHGGSVGPGPPARARAPRFSFPAASCRP